MARKREASRSKHKIKKCFQTIILPFVMPVLITVTTSILSEIIKNYLKQEPIFGVENTVLNPNQPIFIFSKNHAAKHKKPLTVRWNDIEIHENITQICPNEVKKYRWAIAIQNAKKLPDLYKKKDENDLEVGFDYKFPKDQKRKIVFSPEILDPKVDSGDANFLLNLSETINVDSRTNLQNMTNSFCVTEDDIFLIPDQKAGTINIFEKVLLDKKSYLKFIRTLNLTSIQDDEKKVSDRPIHCSYDRNIGRLAVINNNQKSKIIIFEKNDKTDFTLVKTIDWSYDSYDIGISGNGKKLIISGYIKENKKESFALSSVDIETGKFSYMIPSYKKYNLKDYDEYKIEYKEKQMIPAIGLKAFIDIYGDNVFFIWEGAVRIISFNLNLKKMEKIFGFETPYYFNRQDETYTIKLAELYKKWNFVALMKLQKMRAYVRNIFATADHIFVIYETPESDKPDIPTLRLQIYNLDGIPLADVSIDDFANPDDLPGPQMWFDKEKYELYAFSRKPGSDKSEFPILKYEIKIK